MVGHARTARPSGQSRLFSEQAGDVPVLGAAGVKSRSRFGSQKVRGRVHPASWANSPAGTPQGSSAEGEAGCGSQMSRGYEGCGTHASDLHPQGSTLTLFLLLPVPLISTPYQYPRLTSLSTTRESALGVGWGSHKCPSGVRCRVHSGEKGKLGAHTLLFHPAPPAPPHAHWNRFSILLVAKVIFTQRTSINESI